VKRFGLFVLGVLSFAAIAGCSKSPTINIPPPPPARFYVANFVCHDLVVFPQPLSASSTPAFTLPLPGNAGGVSADAAGNVYVPNGTNISVFAQPVTATSVATVVGPIAGAGSFRGSTIDAAGNLWVADATGVQVFEFTLPLGAAPIRTLQCACFGFPFSIAFDRAGHIFVGDDNGTVSVLNIPAATGLSVLAPVAVLTASGTSGIGVDVQNRLYASDFAGGEIRVFSPPFATGNTPAFVFPCCLPSPPNPPNTGFPPAPLLTPELMTFDSSGTLYVAYASDTTIIPTGGVAVYAGPIGKASLPLFTLQGVAAGMSGPNGVAFAP
jgi:hypothetical protein